MKISAAVVLLVLSGAWRANAALVRGFEEAGQEQVRACDLEQQVAVCNAKDTLSSSLRHLRV